MKISILNKKKKDVELQDGTAETVIPTRLEEIAGKNTDLYWAMSRIMFLDPARITTTIDQAAKQASEHEGTGNKIRAEVWYRIAGGIALRNGDVEGVRKFFQKALSISGEGRREYKVMSEEADRAVEAARKYYENL